jgi:KRAB domain-containing zinc finger protein
MNPSISTLFNCSRIHELRVHSIGVDAKPHVCVICAKRFFRADHLRIHQVKENHFENGKPPEIPEGINVEDGMAEEFNCDKCGRSFVSEISLKTHSLTHADELDSTLRIACDQCDRKYTNLKSLEYHKKYIHDLKNVHACTKCSKTFGRISSLKRHESVHEAGSRFKCVDCDKVYKNKVKQR